MKEIKISIKNCITLLKGTLVYSFQEETAFVGNNWCNLISTTVYTLTWIGSIHVIYSNVDLLAGYTRDEMLAYALIGQFTYYLVASLLMKNIYNFIRGINKGSLDLVLTKPMPSLFYTLTRTINLAATLRDASIPLITLLLITNWSNVNVSFLSAVAAIIIAFIGSLSFYLILFWCSLPSIKIGEGEALVDLGVWFGFETINAVPYEGFNQFPLFQKLFVIIPLLISTGLSSSVLLQKTDWLPVLLWTLISFILVSLITVYLWRLSLRSYSSASS